MRKVGILIYVLYFPLLVHSQGIFESAQAGDQVSRIKNLNVNGYVRGSVYGGSDSYDFTTVFGELVLQAKYTPKKALLYTDIRFREGIRFDENKFKVDLREAYVGYRSEKFDFFVGNQIVTWGRTDGFNPTNNINPNDYFFLSAVPDDQILPNFMVRTRYRLSSEIDIELIGIPYFRPSVYRYDLFKINEGVSFDSGELPERKIENSTIAARMNFLLPAAEFSISWFHGYDPFYGFDVKSIEVEYLNRPEVIYQPDYYQKDAIGADLAIPFGGQIVRGEVAYNHTYFYKKYMYVPNPDLAWVVGIERELIGITTILQYIGKFTFDYYPLQKPVLEDPTDIDELIQFARDNVYHESELFNRKIFLQEEETNHALFITLAKSFFHSTMRAEITGYYNFSSDDYFFRPGITWHITDALSTRAGANIMIGPKNSVFDYASDILNGVFAELRVSL